MSPVVILGCLVIIPVVLLMVLRVNAALVFLSVCLGSVLTNFLGPDVNSLLDLVSKQASRTITASRSSSHWSS
jgi:hypothetical protein